jgi:uncharacterized delta-60 repeat protein
VLAGGCFTHVDGVERNSLVQLDPNGAVAEAYDPALQSNESVYALTLQPDGKVLVGGSFTTPVSDPESGWEYSVPSHLLVRLNTDGTRDTGFEVTAGFIDPESPFTSSFVYTIAVQPDGGILAGGSFTAFKGARLTALARLHADGTLNNTFDAAIDGAGAYVRSILLQPDGRILIGGYFDTVDGVERHGIARLNADGSLDESVAQGPGADHVIASLALRPDGKLLLGGLFSSIHGVVCPRLARLHGDDTTPSLTIEQTNGSLLLSWPSALDYHALEKSEDLGRLHPWSPVTETADDDGTRVRVTFPIEAPNMFFRLRSP